MTPYLRRRLQDFVAGRLEVQGAGDFLHKFTGWPRARMLAECFPRARFGHVGRDGRAVANSTVQQEWWSGFRGPSLWNFGPLDGRESHTS